MALVIFAVGNPSRGDDALGPLLMARLEGRALPGVRLVSDFQLQIEHALDLDGQALILFIDAGTGTPAPFRFSEIFPARGRVLSSHALAPAEVLQVYRDIRHKAPPAAFVLCVRGESFELGESLGSAAAAHLAAADALLERLLADPTVGAWRKHAADGG